MRTPRTVAGVTAALLALGLLTAVPVSATTGTPAAPIIVQGSGVGSSDAVLLSWRAVEGATSYVAQIATDATFAPSTILEKVATSNLTWVPQTALRSNDERTLYWRVAAGTETSQTTPWSVETLVRDRAEPPTLIGPGSPNGGTVTYPQAVTFRWEPVPGAVSYQLEYASNPDFTGDVYSATTTEAAYTPDKALPRTIDGAVITWHWRVSATLFTTLTTAPTTPVSDTFAFTYEWPDEVAQPQLLTPADHSSHSDPLFTWTPVPGAASYTITLGKQVSPDGLSIAADNRILDRVKTYTNAFALPDTLTDTDYFWQVTPFDLAGNAGTPSAVFMFTKKWGTQSASSPTSETARATLIAPLDVTVPADRVMLSWQPVPRASYYHVRVLQTNTDKPQTAECRTASTSLTPFAFYGPGENDAASLQQAAKCLDGVTFDEGETFQWEVTPFDLNGGSTVNFQAAPASTLKGVTVYGHFTVGAPTPAVGAQPIQDFAAWEADALPAGQPAPLMSWSRVEDASYRVTIAKNADLTTVVARVRTDQTSLRLNGVFKDDVTGQPYYWAVEACDAPVTDTNASCNVNKNPLAFVKSSAPSTVAAPAASTVGDATILSWEPQFSSAPSDGGYRGYMVEIFSGTRSLGTERVEYPFYVARYPASASSSHRGKNLPSGSYTFRVAPIDAAGTVGRASEPSTFTVGTGRPSIDSVSVGTGSVSLGWGDVAPTGAVDFRVEYRRSGSSAWTAYPSTSKFIAQHGGTVTGLSSGAYEFRVVQRDAASALGVPSAPRTVTIASRAPLLTTPDGAVLRPGSQRLAWSRVVGASRYLVQITPRGGSAKTYETVETSFAPPALVAATGYTWSVTAVPELKTSSTSRIVLGSSSVRAFTAVTLPGAPSSPAATSNGTSVTLTWRDLAGAARGDTGVLSYAIQYRAVRNDGRDNAWTTLPAISTLLSREVKDLARATTYEFRVAATNGVGQGPWSASRTVTTSTVPGVVQAVTATAALGGFSLTWRAPATDGGMRVSGYTVRYRPVGGTWRTTVVTSTSARLSSLSTGTKFEVTVTANNPVGAGPAAATTVTTLALPTAVRSVKVVRGDRKATVSWAAPESTGGQPITGYTVEMRTLSGKTWSTWARKASTTGTRSASITGLKNGTSYQVRVVAQTKIGTGAASSAVQFVPAGKPLATTIKVTSSKKRNVKVTWKAAASNGSKVTGYRVQYSTTGKKWTTLKSLSSKSRSYTWTKAKSKKSYYVRVQAKNALGWGAVSKHMRVTVK